MITSTWRTLVGYQGVMEGSPIPEHILRALRLIELANLGNAYPSRANVNAYAENRAPRSARSVDLTRSLSKWVERAMRNDIPGEPVAEYLQALGWVEYVTQPQRGLRLTQLGRGLVRGVDLKAAELGTDESQALVVTPDDGLRYTALTGKLLEAGRGMLVDPYFKPDMLNWLAQDTDIKRVLVGKRALRADERDRLFPLFLGALGTEDEPTEVEVRVSESPTLHDRAVVGEDGAVWLLGTSLTGLDKHLTTIVPLPSQAGDAWRDHLEELWQDATRIEPRSSIRTDASPAPEVTIMPTSTARPRDGQG